MTSSKCDVDNCKRDYDTVCTHCQQNVCSKHYIEHIKLVNDALGPLADQLNSIMNSIQQTNLIEKVFEQIDEWREMNYRRIDKLCNEKKQQLKAEIEQNIEIQMTELGQLSKQVRELINDGDASFKQIENLKKDINRCQQQCKQFEEDHYTDLNIEINGIERISINKKLFDGNSTLLSLEQQIKLNEFYGREGQTWRLIYKATQDGFASKDFHRCCDNQGPTMTIIQSKADGYLFGGYTSVSWQSIGHHIIDHHPFLFTLTNPHDIPPTKYSILDAIYSTYHMKDAGPIFGCGHDLYVCDDSRIIESSYSNFPCSYNDTTNYGMRTFTGSKHFLTNDIEVYRLMDN